MTSSEDEKSLTFEEAQQRAGLLEVHRYDIDVDLTGMLDGDALRATSTIRFSSREPGAETFVDCVGEVEEARLNGRPVAETGIAAGRIRLADLEPDNVLEVRSVQRNTGQGQGVHRAVDRKDGNVYVWTSFEPDDARRAWACFDQPDLKAEWAFTVTAPAAWTVLSNAGTAEVEDRGTDRFWRFPDTPRLSSYNLVVNAGPLHELRSERAGFDLGLYAAQSLAPMLERDAEELFDLTARGLEFFGDRFGMPFPQRRYDQAFMPEMSGAMENYGCVTWTDSVLYRDPPTFAERERRALVLLHEMAHMWFGDIVTMRWWDDLWLNESFADWACSWAAEAATPFTDAWAGVTFDEIAGYAADASPISHPIAAHLPDVAAATGTFDAITYTKGQAVLKQLVAYVGEDQFLAGLRQYFVKHAWRNAAITDLVGELERASGRDLQAWTQGWLGTAGTDRLEVHRDGGDVVLRARGPEGGAPRPHSLNIGVYDEGETLILREKLAVETSAEATVLPDAARSGVLLVNDDDLTFACVRTDQTSLQRLKTAAGTLPTAIGRAVATTMVWDMVTRGEADAATFVHTAAQVLPSETADSVVEPLLNLVVGAVEAWTPAAERADLSSLVADLCLQVAEAPERSVVGLRGFARVATTPAQLDELTARATDRDLRWRRLERLASLGAANRQDIDAFEREDQVPDAWLRALRVRAGLPDQTAKEETWQAVFEKGEVPAHSFRLVGTRFWQPGHDQLLAPFAERFLEQLPAMATTGLLWAHALTRGMFPTTGVDGAWLDRADALARSGRLAPVVANAVLERSDLTRRMWLARGGVPVSAR